LRITPEKTFPVLLYNHHEKLEAMAKMGTISQRNSRKPIKLRRSQTSKAIFTEYCIKRRIAKGAILPRTAAAKLLKLLQKPCELDNQLLNSCRQKPSARKYAKKKV